jgi:hypothetical protein
MRMLLFLMAAKTLNQFMTEYKKRFCQDSERTLKAGALDEIILLSGWTSLARLRNACLMSAFELDLVTPSTIYKSAWSSECPPTHPEADAFALIE